MSRKQRVLVVEDDPLSLATIKDILAGLDYNIIEASSGEMALKEIRRTAPDVILLDLKLPGIEGFETLRRARKIRRNLCPVIILTGYNDSHLSFAAGKLAVFDYLIKDDLDIGKLKDTVIRAANRDGHFLSSPIACYRHNRLGCFEDLAPQENLVFVGMPFNMVDIFEHAIEPIITTLNLKCYRADQDKSPGDIACKISYVLQSCRVAIMEISDMNPNVCFEVGLAYGYGVPVILLRKTGSIVPTDLAGILCLEYYDINSLRAELSAHLKAVLRSK